MANNEVWKFGITRVQPFDNRPASQMNTCGPGCYHSKKEDVRATGWFQARFLESNKFFDYWITHNFQCPPGARFCI